MKKQLALILALCLCLSLWACGGSAEVPTQEPETEAALSADGLYEKSGTMDNGTAYTVYRLGGPEGTVVKAIYDYPGGAHCEEHYTDEGVLEYTLSEEADGSVYETYYYPSGNIFKDIMHMADGSYQEMHFTDDGYTDDEGWVHTGTLIYEKYVSPDGEETEYSPDISLEDDGSRWETIESEDGTVTRNHYSASGTILETHMDMPQWGQHFVTLYHENGNQKSQEVTHDDTEEYSLDEYYEDGSLKYSYRINYGGLTGTEQEEKVGLLGYTTYLRITHPASGTMEFIADENGNLQQYVDNGAVSEGAAITADVWDTWENVKTKPAATVVDTVTEQDADGSTRTTTTYSDGKVMTEHFSADGILLSSDTVEADGQRFYMECYESGQTKYHIQTFADGRTYEYYYDEEGFETYYHEYGGNSSEIEIITDEDGKIEKVLINGVEEINHEWLTGGHHFRQ